MPIEQVETDLRRNSHQRVGTSRRNPFNPCIAVPGVSRAVFEVPVVTGVGEVSEGIVGGDSISSPSRNRYTEIFNVCCTCWEVDTVDKIRNGVNVGLIDTID